MLREAAEFLEIQLSAILKIFQQSYGSLPQTAQNPLVLIKPSQRSLSVQSTEEYIDLLKLFLSFTSCLWAGNCAGEQNWGCVCVQGIMSMSAPVSGDASSQPHTLVSH